MFTTPIVYFLFVPFFLAGNPFENPGAYMLGLAQGLVLAVIVSPFVLVGVYILVGIIYLPFHDLLRRINHRSLLAVVAASSTVSMIFYALPGLVFILDDGTSYANCPPTQEIEPTACEWRGFSMYMTLWAIYGAVCGAVFWFIYAGGWRLRLRPDEWT